MQSRTAGNTEDESQPRETLKDDDEVGLELKAEISRMVDEFVDADTVVDGTELGRGDDDDAVTVSENKDDDDAGNAPSKARLKTETPALKIEQPAPSSLQKKSATSSKMKSAERKKTKLMRELLEAGREELASLQFGKTLSKQDQKQSLNDIVKQWKLSPKQVRKPSVVKVPKECLLELSNEIKSREGMGENEFLYY